MTNIAPFVTQNSLNSGGESMYVGILCRDIKKAFFYSRVNDVYLNTTVNNRAQARFRPNFHIIQHHFAR